MSSKKVTLLSTLQVVKDFSCSNWEFKDLPPGDYIVEQVDNPLGLPGKWQVIEGTREGIGEELWERKSRIRCRSKRARFVPQAAV